MGDIGTMMKGSGLEESLETVVGENAAQHMMSGKAVFKSTSRTLSRWEIMKKKMEIKQNKVSMKMKIMKNIILMLKTILRKRSIISNQSSVVRRF